MAAKPLSDDTQAREPLEWESPVAQTTTDDEDAVPRAHGEADYYAILGVTPDASRDEIHQAYRRLAKLWHPDRYTYAPQTLRDRAERRMRAISRAWSELDDPISRRAYDQRRYGSPWRAAEHRAAMATTNPPNNGAGMFVGMLCVILALPLLINLLSGAAHEGWQVALMGAFALGLATLVGMFFTGDSFLARQATRWAEGEPRGFYDQPVASHTAHASHWPSGAFADDEDPGDDDVDGARAFDQLVEQALAIIPDDFKPYMENVLVRVKREATEEELRRLEVGPGGILFGLYTGVPLTAQGAQAVGTEIVTIYRGPIERYCHGDPERIREQVRRTVLHEVAHHFGIGHDAMPDWLK